MNQWRSRTAETIFRELPGHSVRSAGTDVNAQVKVNAQLLEWADRIFVMEDKHKEFILKNFRAATSGKKIIVLGIPDEYQYMNEELISLLGTAVNPYLT